MGGLIVGMVTKHAGGVVKGFAMIAGIIVTGLVQWILYSKPLSYKDFFAILLVSYSIYLHSSYPVNKARPIMSQLALLVKQDSDASLDRKIAAQKYTTEWRKEQANMSCSTTTSTTTTARSTAPSGGAGGSNTTTTTTTLRATCTASNDYSNSNYSSSDHLSQYSNHVTPSAKKNITRKKSNDTLLSMAATAVSVSPSNSLADLHHRTLPVQ